MYELRLRRGDLIVEQGVYCIPLLRRLHKQQESSDEPTAAMVRFVLRNASDKNLKPIPVPPRPCHDKRFHHAGRRFGHRYLRGHVELR